MSADSVFLSLVLCVCCVFQPDLLLWWVEPVSRPHLLLRPVFSGAFFFFPPDGTGGQSPMALSELFIAANYVFVTFAATAVLLFAGSGVAGMRCLV